MAKHKEFKKVKHLNILGATKDHDNAKTVSNSMVNDDTIQ